MEVSLKFDVAQQRVKTDRVAALISGEDWNEYLVSDVFVEPSTRTAIIQPAARRPEWYTNGAGINTRWRKSDFTLSSGSWLERLGSNVAGDYVLDLIGTNEPIITISALSANQGVVVSWFVYGDSRDDFTQMECGWNNTATGASGVSLRMNPAGDAEVWKDNTLVGVYSLCQGTIGDDVSGKWIQVCLIPAFRRTGLLVITNTGGSFFHNFEDLDDSADNQTVTGATKFWAYVAEGQASIQLAPLKYPSNGRIWSKRVFFADIATGPQQAAVLKTVFADLKGNTTSLDVVEQDAHDTAYDFSDLKARLKVTLNSASGLSSPNLYGAQVEYPRVTANTDNSEEAEMILHTTAMGASIPESPANCELSVKIRNPDDTAVDNLKIGQRRPVRMVNPVDSALLWEGVTEEPDWDDHWNPAAEYIDLKIRDMWALLEDYVYRDPKAWDGVYFDTFITDVVTDAGLSSSAVSVESDGFILPAMPPSGTDFNVYAQRGDSAASVLLRFISKFAPDWMFGFRPTGGTAKLFAGSPDWYGLTPLYKFYWSLDTAKAELAPGTVYIDHVYQSFAQKPLPIGSNYIKITGIDMTTGLPIEVFKQDLAAQDPTLPPSSRPNNWWGSPKLFGMYDPAFTNLDVCERVCNKAYEREVQVYVVAEWMAPMAFKTSGDPVWRGDLVTLSEHGDFRVLTVAPHFAKVQAPGASGTDSFYRVPTRYTGIKAL